MSDVLLANDICQSITDAVLSCEDEGSPDAKAEAISQTAASKLREAN